MISPPILLAARGPQPHNTVSIWRRRKKFHDKKLRTPEVISPILDVDVKTLIPVTDIIARAIYLQFSIVLRCQL